MAPAVIQFETIELDLGRYELRRAGHAVKLEHQPMELLILLVSRQGSLVTREEIIASLWGNDVFLDADQGINNAIRKIRLALRDDPDEPRFLETVVGKGYRFIAQITEPRQEERALAGAEGPSIQPVPALQPDAPQAVTPSSPQPRRRISTGLRVALAALSSALLVAVTVTLARYGYRIFTADPAIPSVAVLPLAGDSAETEYLRDGITDTLIDSVSQLSGVKVISHVSAFHYKGKEIDPGQVGRDLMVRAVLTGQVVQQGDTIVVRVELTDTLDNTHLWGRLYTRKMADVAGLQRDLDQDVAQQLRRRISGEEKRRLAAESAGNSEAYQLVLRGRYYQLRRTPEDYEIARHYFEQAVEKDPAYAVGYSSLAGLYSQLADDGVAPPGETILKAKAYVRKANQVDPGSALGAGIVLLYDWNFQEAGRLYGIRVASSPSNAEFYRNYAIYLRVVGRPDEAIAAAERARALDPLSVAMNSTLGWEYYYAHRYPQAIEQFRTSTAMDPGFLSAKYGLALAYQHAGKQEEALAALEDYVTATGDTDLAARLGQTRAQSGYAAAMRQFTQSVLAANLEASKQNYRPPMVLAGQYAVLGDKDNSFLWLEKAFEERSSKLLDLKVDPDFDNLRADPRFTALVRRVGLP